MSRADAEAKELLSMVVDIFPHSIWFADIDDTLIDTLEAHKSASKEIADILEPMIGERSALTITKRFLELFQILMNGHRTYKVEDQAESPDDTSKQYKALRARIDDCQEELRKHWGAIKVFSREVLLTLAGEDCGFSLAPQQISKCIHHYWGKVADYALCFDDACKLLKVIAEMNRPLYLFTSSDGRLNLRIDGQFEYDPEMSRRLKRARIEKLRAKGLQYRDLFIGDPVDKPNPEFFEVMYRSVASDLGEEFKLEHTIILGDSYDADLHVPVTVWKTALGIWYRRGQVEVAFEKERVITVGNWQVLSNLLTSKSL